MLVRTEVVGNADRAFDRPQIGGEGINSRVQFVEAATDGGVEWRRRKVNSNQKIGLSAKPEIVPEVLFCYILSNVGTEEEVVIKAKKYF